MATEFTKAIKIFDAVNVPAGGSVSSAICDLTRTQGYQSLQYTITGSGTVSFTFSLSNDGKNFATPDGATAIGEDLIAGSGLLPITLASLATHIKIIATETGGTNSATITAVLAVK